MVVKKLWHIWRVHTYSQAVIHCLLNHVENAIRWLTHGKTQEQNGLLGVNMQGTSWPRFIG